MLPKKKNAISLIARGEISFLKLIPSKTKKKKNEKKSYKIPKDGIMKDSTTVDYRANRKIGEVKKKKKKGGKRGRLSRENRLNVGF